MSNKDTAHKHGNGRNRVSGCGECRIAGNKSARTAWAKKKEFVDNFKVEQGCVDCGYNENPMALDFDHTKGKKVMRVSNMLRYSWEKILAEMDKCEVRCANCHRIVTWERRYNQERELINV